MADVGFFSKIGVEVGAETILGDAVDYAFLGAEVNVLDGGVGLWQGDDGTVENGGLHSATHHSIREKGCDTSVAVVSFGVAEAALKGLPVHRVVGLEEAEVGKESV